MTEEGFIVSLTQEEIEIIAILMTVEWLRPKIFNIEILRQSLNTKDWSLYSQANHLKELSALKKSAEEDADTMIVSYTHNNGSYEGLR